METHPRMGRPSGADSERTRERIMDVAMTHVAEVGYRNATLKSIAERAGLTSGAIYHYFRSKQDLVVTIVTTLVTDVVGRLDEAAQIAAPLQQRLVAVLDEALASVQDYPALTKFEASVSAEAGQHPEFQRALASRREAEEKLYHRLVDHAVRHGELATDVDRQAMVDMFMAITWGLTHLSVSADVDRHREAIKATESLLIGSIFTFHPEAHK